MEDQEKQRQALVEGFVRGMSAMDAPQALCDLARQCESLAEVGLVLAAYKLGLGKTTQEKQPTTNPDDLTIGERHIVLGNNPIQAIKDYRNRTGAPLVDARNKVLEYRSTLPKDHPAYADYTPMR